MTSIAIPLIKKPSDEIVSNRFLRALWAALRLEFGKLFWQYIPSKDRDYLIIHFGYADLALPSKIRISVTYKRRGVIESIIFDDVGNNDLPISRFENCVRIAEASNESDISIAANILIAYRFLFQNNLGSDTFRLLIRDSYRFDFFSLFKKNKHKADFFHFLNDNWSLWSDFRETDLLIRVRAFDAVDANNQFLLYAPAILDTLSAFTNLFFEIDKITNPCPPFSSTFQIANPPLKQDWIDGYPFVERKLVLNEECLRLINNIVQDNIDKDKQIILDACHHFHAARFLEEQSYIMGQSQSLSEIAMVHYISSLEVLSLVGSPNPSTCPTCNQVQFRISARVKEFVEKHHGLNVAKFVKNTYNDRSQYLHTGRLLSSRSYYGQTIPQLDFSTQNRNRSPMVTLPLLNLREYVSYCIRKVTCELYAHQSCIENL
jgi:hypothetical protein